MLPTTRKTDIGNTGVGNEKESTSQVKKKFSPASTVYVLSLEGGSKMILGGAGWKDIEDEYFVEFMQYLCYHREYKHFRLLISIFPQHHIYFMQQG